MADCQHEVLQFQSGDYYLFCTKCNGRWGRLANVTKHRPEYGIDKDGNKIGCDSTECGLFLDSNPYRIRESS